MDTQRQVFGGLIVAAVLGATAPAAWAQGTGGAFPNKPIRIVVPYAAGGGADVMSRALAQKLSENLGESVFVENRAGGAGVPGTDFVAKSAPDGHTLLLATSGHAIFPSMAIKLPFDAVADFAPVTQLTSQAFLVSVPAALPAKTMAEFIALAKSKPGALNYASGGLGTAPHLGIELLKTMTGIDMVHIPYRGGNPATLALVAGEVSVLLNSVGPTMTFLKSGKLRALAVTSLQRQSAVPDVPTVSETVAPGFEVISWYSIMAPAKTTVPVLNRLHTELVKAMNSAELKQRVSNDGSELVGSAPPVFAQYVKAEVAKWAAVVKAANVRLE